MHIGRISQDYDFDGAELAVVFTNCGSGRRTLVDCLTYSYATDISVVLDAFQPVSGQMYMVRVVGKRSQGGITPLVFSPYEYDTTGEDYAFSTQTADTVFVQFVKTFDDTGAVFGSTVQYLTV